MSITATAWVHRWGAYDRLLVCILFLAILLTCGLTPMQSDTWWQLRAGQDIFESGRVVLTDTYSHTAYGSFWLNHEWLAEVIYYIAYRTGGLPLLTLFAGALIAGGWTFTWRLTKGSARRAFVLSALALVCSSGWWEPRPHAFSLLFIPATVFLIARDRHWWLPPVFLVWANCHGGVLLGFVLLGAGLAAQVVVDVGAWRRSAAVTIACIVSTTATPLGLAFWTEIPRSLMRINQYTLDEWERTSFTELEMIPFWVISVTFCAFLVRDWRRLPLLTREEATIHACTLALLPLAIGAVRNVGPFVMIAVPALTYLMHTGRPLPEVSLSTQRSDKPILNLALMVALAAGVVITLSAAYRAQWPRLKWTPVPQAALSALESCPDNLYNRYDEGGILLWFAPNRKVFLDGRQDPFPSDLILDHIAMETGMKDHTETFGRHEIRCAFLPVASPVASGLLKERWVRLYQGPQWVVFRQVGP